MPKMNREQRDYLFQRVRTSKKDQAMPWCEDDACERPAEVRRAEQVIAGWKVRHNKAREAHNDKIAKREAVATEAIYAGDYAKALEAVKRFEVGK